MGAGTRLAAGAMVAAVAVTFAASAAAPAWAQAPQSAEQREASARQLFALGKYTEALDIYSNLFAETTHPTYLRNIGRCYQNLGEPDKAISSFREYLRQMRDLPADQRTLVEGYVREMEDLKRKREGERAATGADAAPKPDVVVTPASTSGPALVTTAPPPNQPSAPDTATPSRTPAYVVAGVSLAALGAGTFFGLRALANKRAADPLCPMDQCTTDGYSKNEAAVRDARITDVALGVGLLGAGVATYLFLRSSGGGASQPEPTAGFHIRPEIGPGLAKVSAEAHW